jgi:two-component system OmpR family response regulator
MPESGDSFRFGRWTLHVDRRELVDDTDVVTPLSSSEFLLLTVFLARPEIVLNRDQLLDLTRGRAAKVFDRSIDNQVSRLRRKIEEDPKNPKLIQTVWGGGYRFSTTVEKL